MYHLSCTGHAIFVCMGHTPSLMCRLQNISRAQVMHHLCIHRLHITLMHWSHTLSQTHASQSCLYTNHLLACTEHAISASCYCTCVSLCCTTIHASALKTCILGRALAQFAPQQNPSSCSCCTDIPNFLCTCTWSTGTALALGYAC
jgi:hypothetical protein